jgi:folylpolyglutamate synthase/dihydropteroate synthase
LAQKCSKKHQIYWALVSVFKNPLIICDTAHNQAGLEMVFAQLNSIESINILFLVL